VTQAGPVSPPKRTTIPGYEPIPLTVATKARGGRIAIVLVAKRYGPTGSAQYQVVTGPHHGRLSVPIGALLNHATIICRANRRYRGTDQFRYIALDSASSRPRHRVSATVTVDIGAGLGYKDLMVQSVTRRQDRSSCLSERVELELDERR
jgi:hypothetical protein